MIRWIVDELAADGIGEGRIGVADVPQMPVGRAPQGASEEPREESKQTEGEQQGGRIPFRPGQAGAAQARSQDGASYCIQ